MELTPTLKVLITVPCLQIFKTRLVVFTLIPLERGQVAALANKATGKKTEIIKKIAFIFVQIDKY